MYAGGTISCNYRYLTRLSTGKMVLPVLSVLTMHGESLYKAASIRFFKFVWGLPAGTEDPKK